MLFDGVNGANAGMVQRRRRARFAKEALERRGVFGGLGGQGFLRDRAGGPGAPSFGYPTPRAAPDVTGDTSRPQRVASPGGSGRKRGERRRKKGPKSLGGP